MDCCYVDCGPYAVTPVLMTPCYSIKPCEDAPMCYPCLPQCPPKPVFCCEKKSKILDRVPRQECMHIKDCNKCSKGRQCCENPPRQSKCPSPSHQSRKCCLPDLCPTCYQPAPICKPVKTKYVMPCYRYEDGRIEQYVPTRHGRLPMSAYRRNGIQDQMYGYRGAVRYLCAGEGSPDYCVYTAIVPLRKFYPKITQEVGKLPVTAFKRNGMQDQEHSKQLGATNYLSRCPRDVSIEYDVCKIPVKVCDPAKVPNQPTVLMKRACEVAFGVKCCRKPCIESTHRTDSCNEKRRYHSENEQGNCCHFERKHPSCPSSKRYSCQTCSSSPQCRYVDCDHT